MKCKICHVELKKHYNSNITEFTLIGSTVPATVDYLYCPKCGLMYQSLEE